MKLWRVYPVLLTIILGITASMGIILLCASWQRKVASLDFQHKAEFWLSVINTDLGGAASVIETLRDRLESSDVPVSRAEFTRFATALHRHSAGLRDTGWAPRITRDARQDFVAGVRASGLPQFDIWQQDAAGGTSPARDRGEHYPILFVEPQSWAPAILGFDLATEPNRAAAINRAIASGQAATTPPIALITGPAPRAGVLSVVPVTRKLATEDAATPANDRPPDGVVFGAFEIQPMIDTIISAKLRLPSLDIYLFDPAGPVGDRLIYWRSGAGQPGPPPTEQALRAMPHWEGMVTLVDQHWGVLFAPVGGLPLHLWAWDIMIPFASGLLLTAMSVAYLVASLRRTARLEALTTTLRGTTGELRRQARTIARLAGHDDLTDLPNRRLFARELQRLVELAEQQQRVCALLLVDLDGFKPVNDAYGHAVGDLALCAVAARLRAVIRQGDSVARLGGDEFAVITVCCHGSDTPSILARRIIHAISQPITALDKTIAISASIGIALWPIHTTDTQLLVCGADQAMYEAKRRQPGSFGFFSGATPCAKQDRA